MFIPAFGGAVRGLPADRGTYLGPELAESDLGCVPNVRVERLPDASHWVEQDRSERVDQLLLDSPGTRAGDDEMSGA